MLVIEFVFRNVLVVINGLIGMFVYLFGDFFVKVFLGYIVDLIKVGI